VKRGKRKTDIRNKEIVILGKEIGFARIDSEYTLSNRISALKGGAFTPTS